MVHRKKDSFDDEKPEQRVNNRAQIEKANNGVRSGDALQESQLRQAEISALLEGARAVLAYREFKDSARSIFDSCKAVYCNDFFKSEWFAERIFLFVQPGITVDCVVKNDDL